MMDKQHYLDSLHSSYHAFTKSRFVRNVAVLASGAVASQAITIVFTPFITRIYGPEAFGVLSSFMAILAILIPIAAFTYPIAIVLPKSDREAIGLARLSVGLALLMAALLTLIIMLYRDSIASMLGLDDIGNFLILIPLAMLFVAFYQTLQQWLIRKKQFTITARVAVIQSLWLNLAKTGIGWFHPIALVLIVIATLSGAFHTLLLWLSIRKKADARPLNNPVIAGEKNTSIMLLASKYKDFPTFRSPQEMINALSQGLPVLMLASLFGPSSAGFYALGKSVMGLPSVLIGKAVSDVFYPQITESVNNKKNVSHTIIKTTLILFAIGLVPFGAVIIFGPWLFEVFFGVGWGRAGEYARWLALFFLFNFINKPSVAAVPALGLQKGLLIYEIVSTFSKVAGFTLFALVIGDDVLAVATFCLIGVLAYSAMILWIILSAKRWEKYAKTS